jgi:hypothetical protein
MPRGKNGWSKIRASALSQPPNQTNNTLITLLAFNEGWAVIIFDGIGNGVNQEAGVLQSGIWGDVS